MCFPQFSDFGPLAQHGFARNSQFEVLSRAEDSVTLVLRSSDATRQLWPHDFELLITVRAAGTRTVSSVTHPPMKALIGAV